MEATVEHILDYGVVGLLDVFGSDARIADAARVSYSGVQRQSSDRTLIRYLMQHRHTSPFEMAEVLFYLKIPIFVMRQLVRHRTANINEVSARYSELPNEYYVPDPEQCGPQSTDNKQGRSPVTTRHDERFDVSVWKTRQTIDQTSHQSHDVYDSLLHVSGVSREISRIVLPLNTYTALYWKIDLHNFFHMLRLRLDLHAQYEIRVMAEAMFRLARPHFPIAFEAFEDYILNSQSFSALDQQLLFTMLQNAIIPPKEFAEQAGMSEREYTEFCDKVSQLQLNMKGL